MAKNGRLDARDRGAVLDRLARTDFDVLVIGGGVTGAGAALDAASRGLRVALVEARDLASGTSSRSSKLIHGGLRYLEQFDFKLVWEALRERDLLVSKLAPHLVEPVSSCTRCIARWSSGRTSARASCCTTRSKGPSVRPPPPAPDRPRRPALSVRLKPSGLAGALLYYDAQADDARYTLTVARTAAAHGAVVATRSVPAVAAARTGRASPARGFTTRSPAATSTSPPGGSWCVPGC